jgi:predicted  nucleic acid-binding Zn-ribbon protein|tara:strand:- start:5389 stop:5682 length:294 start_codon:yes stop_codon:yes gene_type:complete
MERGISAINEIREYVKGLQKSINGYRENEEKIASQLKKLDEEKTNLQNEINQLQEQVKLLKLAKQLEGDSVKDTKEVKLKINEMVREIDKCIALMNK